MFEWFRKRNPAQREIVDDQGKDHHSTTRIRTIAEAYKSVEVVNRGINLIVDSSSEINTDVKERVNTLGVVKEPIRAKKLETLINFKPNPHQDISSFRRNIYMDLIAEGNAFLFFDGAWLYNIPACKMVIIADDTTFISHYEYGEIKFQPNEIIHIKENAVDTIYRGISRVLSALDSINSLVALVDYQTNFLDNGTVSSLVLSNVNPQSQRMKDKIRSEWSRNYSIKRGAKRPIILDGDWKLNPLGASTIQELDFENSVVTLETRILEALGVPPVLIFSGNNANINPNILLFYRMTVLPLVGRVNFALERYFGYNLKAIEADIAALRPDLNEVANYWSTLVSIGIVSRNEAREALRFAEDDGPRSDELVIPANIAGSATSSAEGGRPLGEEN